MQEPSVRKLLTLRDPAAITVYAGPMRPSEVCLACLHADARFELLTGAWDALLGYPHGELEGCTLAQLLAGGPAGAAASLRRLLDRTLADPVRVDVRLRNGAVRPVLVYRRFEESAPSVYFACEPFEGAGPAISPSSFRSSALNTA
jgi:hypothetical protein